MIQGVVDYQSNDDLAKDAGAISIYTYQKILPITNPPTYGWTFKSTVKASNSDTLDNFGTSVTLDIDGTTLAVGAIGEQSYFTGVFDNNSNNNTADPKLDNSVQGAGAVYIY